MQIWVCLIKICTVLNLLVMQILKQVDIEVVLLVIKSIVKKCFGLNKSIIKSLLL